MISGWLVLNAALAGLPVPPDAPQKEEVVISGQNDLVAARCAHTEGRLYAKLKLKTIKVVVTTDPRWGTIWRADTAFPIEGQKEHRILNRSVCWNDGILERPLEMFDPKQSILPLK